VATISGPFEKIILIEFPKNYNDFLKTGNIILILSLLIHLSKCWLLDSFSIRPTYKVYKPYF